MTAAPGTSAAGFNKTKENTISRQATPTVTLTPFTCGQLTRPLSSLLDGRSGQISVPVPAYLIEHPTGLAVFDTGVGPRFARQMGEPLSGPVDLHDNELIDARLRAIGVNPMRVSYILNSHLHYDHAGGNALLPAACVITQLAEWERARRSDSARYHAPEFDTGQYILGITGQHDVFGDNSVILVPTPGHTPGHQSARVQTSSGEVVLAGDACLLQRSLDDLVVPEEADDPDRYRTTLEWFRSRQQAGSAIAFGHDPAFWATVPQSVPWTHPAGLHIDGQMLPSAIKDRPAASGSLPRASPSQPSSTLQPRQE